jgi:uncharacterized protein YcaQ
MEQAHQLSRADARRIAVRAQLLTAERPDDLVELVDHLTLIQIEPTAAVAPSADLVAWSRLGSSYSPDDLRDLLDRQVLVEHHSTVRTLDHLQLVRADMDAWPGTGELRPWQEDQRAWVHTNDGCRRDILARLRADGPLPQSELPDTCVRKWGSSGWNDNKNVQMLLGLMVERGEVAIAGREGREKLWDLAERIYPDEPYPPAEEARRRRDEQRLRALGIARARSAKVPGEPNHVGDAGEPAVVEGVSGTWRVDPRYLDQPFEGRAALLSPFDRLVADRKRTLELFEFDYLLEMYKPAAQRRWGYYALPILYADRLVGKLDATADRKAWTLRVDAVHEDEPFPPEVTEAVDAEIEELARWLGLDLYRADRD